MRREGPLPLKDRLIVALLVFFTAIALTLELYWIVHRTEMLRRTDLFARILAIYWPADRTYRDPVLDSAQAFTLGVETVATFVSPWLSAWLVFAILRARPYRHWLQLTLATYTFYGTFLYYWVNHLSGYAVMEARTPYALALFYGTNLPWILGYGYMACDSIVAIHRRFRATPAG